MKNFKEMIKEYGREASRLAKYKKALEEKMRLETDVDKRKDYELRINTLEAERYEILADMRAMMLYVSGKAE